MSSPIDVQLMLDLALDFKPGVPAAVLVMLGALLLAALAYVTWTDAIDTEKGDDGQPLRDEDGHLVRRRIIPNHVTYPGILLAMALSPVLFTNWGMHLAFGIGTFVTLFTVSVLAGGGFGMGDTKLYSLAGFIVGPGVLLVIMLAATLGIVIGVTQARMRGKRAIGHGIPHGPQIAVALAVVIALALVVG